MASKPSPSSAAAAARAENHDDPVARAADLAPPDDVPETDEERAEVERRRANPVLVPGHAVTAMLAERRREEG